MYVLLFIELIGSDVFVLICLISNLDVIGIGGRGIYDYYCYIFIVCMECVIIVIWVSYVRFLGEFVLFV